jgi:uncharacterized protein (DUF58 family)
VDNLRSIVSRIKWRSVLAVALIIGVLFILGSNLPSGYNVSGNVGVGVSISPATVRAGEASDIEVRLRNYDRDGHITVVVKGQTYEPEIIFSDDGGQSFVSAPIRIGPEGERKIVVSVKSQASTLSGKYPVDIVARTEDMVNPPKNRVFLNVRRD